MPSTGHPAYGSLFKENGNSDFRLRIYVPDLEMQFDTLETFTASVQTHFTGYVFWKTLFFTGPKPTMGANVTSTMILWADNPPRGKVEYTQNGIHLGYFAFALGELASGSITWQGNARSNGFGTVKAFGRFHSSSSVWDTTDVHPDQPHAGNTDAIVSLDQKIDSGAQHVVVGLKRFNIAAGSTMAISGSANSIAPGEKSVRLSLESNNTRSNIEGGALSYYVAQKDKVQSGDWYYDGQANAVQKIKFDKSFGSPPTIVVWISGFSVEGAEVLHLNATASAVANDGFDLTVLVPVDSQSGMITFLKGSWLAVDGSNANGAPTVKTFDYPAVSGNPAQQKKHGKFDGLGKFGQVVAGFSMIDVNFSPNDLRMNLDVVQTSDTGFDWTVEAWSGSSFNGFTAHAICFA